MNKRGPTPNPDQEGMHLAKLARRRASRASDPAYRERAAAYQRDYVARHGDRETLRRQAWREANPEQKRVNRQARRARVYSAPGRHTKRDLELISHWQGGRCAYCDSTSDLHLDHVIPLARGGSNWPWNLQYLCGPHNVAKGSRIDSEYRQIIGLPPAVPLSLTVWRAALLLPLQSC